MSVPIKKCNKPKKEDVIRDKKVQGLAHVNHKGKFIKEKCIGENCKCKRFKCFQITTNGQRENIFQSFYRISSKNLQDNHLAGLITINKVKQRRSRKLNEESNSSDSEGEATLPANYHHVAAYLYKVRVKISEDTNDLKEVVICKKAFLCFHSITAARLRRIQSKLCSSAMSPIDKSGKHGNNAKKMPASVENLISHHIQSFKPRQSQYSIRKNPSRYYLPETLNSS